MGLEATSRRFFLTPAGWRQLDGATTEVSATAWTKTAPPPASVCPTSPPNGSPKLRSVDVTETRKAAPNDEIAAYWLDHSLP
jgi:hypothetical protein